MGENQQQSQGSSWGQNGNSGAAWSCCNDEQSLFILLYLAFALLAVITWNTIMAKPMRLMAVFIHEWSHAVACLLTCGEVKQIEVYENEGGVTTFRGGCRCLIIPAGYIGCGLSAMIFVILSGGHKTALFACVCFTISLILCLCYSPNRLLVYLCLAYAVINVLVGVLAYLVYSPVLQFLILFYGVSIGIYSIADIHEDTVVREIKGSDAHACSEEVCHGCKPQWIGLQWAIMAIAFQCIAIWIALVEMSEECENLGWIDCLNLSADVQYFSITERNWEFDGFWQQAGETIQQMRAEGFQAAFGGGQN